MDVTASWFPYEFTPEMTHQVFGDSECIFGYRGLNIKWVKYYFLIFTFLLLINNKALYSRYLRKIRN